MEDEVEEVEEEEADGARGIKINRLSSSAQDFVRVFLKIPF